MTTPARFPTDPSIRETPPAQSGTAEAPPSAVPAKAERSAGGNAANDLPGESLEAELILDVARLKGLEGPWRRLIEVASESNPFFEPECLLPALAKLGGIGVGVVAVTGKPRQHPEGESVLVGLFPVHLTGKRTTLWTHRYSFLGTPHVRADSVDAAWERFIQWAFEERRKALLVLSKLSVDGPVFRSLLGVLRRGERPSWVQDQHLRATFESRGTAGAFIESAISGKVRRNLRRSRRQLDGQGMVTFSAERLSPDGVNAWAEEFLELEGSGWKGAKGSALACDADGKAWFEDTIAEFAASGRFIGGALRLNGKPIAMGCKFESGGSAGEAVYFKTAYDEAYSEYSVGTLLQWEWIEWLHGPSGLRQVDSCASPGHPMIERIWDGRRMIQTVWVGSGTRASRITLGALPMARWLKSKRRRST